MQFEPEARARPMSGSARVVFLAVLLALYGLVLAWQTMERVLYPWDMLIWAEGPFMNDMLKLAAGMPFFTSPEDGASFVYSPALGLLTYGVLSPFELATDVRACRAVNVMVGLTAAMVAAKTCFALMATRRAAMERLSRSATRLTVVLLFVLLLFTNYTADSLHPDNLHVLHGFVTVLLAMRAAREQTARAFVVAAFVAGLGFAMKQTAVLAPCVVVVAALRYGGVGMQRVRRVAWTVAGAGLGTLVATYHVMVSDDAWFWTVGVLAQHGRDPYLAHRASFDVWLRPDRALIVAGVVAMGGELWRRVRARDGVHDVWLSGLVFCAAPAVLGYVKHMGYWNNLTVIEMWLAVGLVATVLTTTALTTTVRGRSHAVATVCTGLAALSLVPLKQTPSPMSTWIFAEVDRMVAADLAAGLKVLVTHGTAFRLHAGDATPQRHLGNAWREMDEARLSVFSGLETAIATRAYDRIYVTLPSSLLKVFDDLHRSCREVRRFAHEVPSSKEVAYLRGVQPHTVQRVHVFDCRR